jgi:hypothetical protein
MFLFLESRSVYQIGISKKEHLSCEELEEKKKEWDCKEGGGWRLDLRWGQQNKP